MVKKVLYFLLFIFLSVLTQIGGIVLLLSLLASNWLKTKFRFNTLLIFVILYLATTFLLVPHVAPKFGRSKIAYLQPTNFATVLLNRNYINSEYRNTLRRLNGNLRNQGVELHFLDANFPFIDGFPLLPHLSHNDGKKLDLSLIYETQGGKISKEQKSVSGYGVFEGPIGSETNQIAKCKDAGYFQYDYPKYLSFGKINNHLQFSAVGTKKIIATMLKEESLDKMFIEPHLKQRMRLNHTKIRYHGCGAVRHDDHIHIQFD